MFTLSGKGNKQGQIKDLERDNDDTRPMLPAPLSVSYTHLTLPTNREV